MTSARENRPALTCGIVPEHDARVYVAGLVIVAAIVNWLVHTLLTSLTAAFIVPSLERARRASTSAASGRDYERGLALAHIVRAVLDALAVFATCSYYAANNLPAWPAWVVFSVFFAVLQLPRLIASGAVFAGVKRSAA